MTELASRGQQEGHGDPCIEPPHPPPRGLIPPLGHPDPDPHLQREIRPHPSPTPGHLPFRPLSCRLPPAQTSLPLLSPAPTHGSPPDTVLAHPRAQHRVCLLYPWAPKDRVRLQNILGGSPGAIKHVFASAPHILKNAPRSSSETPRAASC